MASQTNTLTFTLRIDLPALLRDLEKGLDAIASMVTKAQKALVKVAVDVEDARKQAREARKAIDEEMGKGGTAPRTAPSQPRPKPQPASGPSVDVGALEAAELAKLDALREQYSSRDKRRDRERGAELLDSIQKLNDKRLALTNQASKATEKAAKDAINAQKRQAEEELRLLNQVAKERRAKEAEASSGFMATMKSRVTEGMGLGAGIAVFDTIVEGVGSVASKMIGANAEMERYQTQLGTLMKGTADFKERNKGITDPLELNARAAKEAKERIAELSKFGAETPFELPEIAAAEKVLIGFGLTGKRAMELTGQSATELRTTIGDVSAGVGVPFQELTVTLGKFSTGATGEAIARLQELGAVTKEELRGAGIEFDKAGSLISPVPKALSAAVAIMKNKFGGGMKDLSATFEGQMSTLSDTATQTLGQIGQPFFAFVKNMLGGALELFSTSGFQAVVTGATGAINGFFAGISAVGGFIGDNLPVFVGLAGAVGVLAIGLNAGAIASGVMAVAQSIAAGATIAWAKATSILNAVMALNPVFLIAAGVAVLVGAVALFIGGTKDLGEATDDATKSRQAFNATIEETNQKIAEATAIDALAERHQRLSKATDPASQKEMAAAAAELQQKVPGAVNAIDQYDAAGKRVNTTYQVTPSIIRQTTDEMRRMAEEARADALATMNENASALIESLQEAREEQTELRSDNTELNALAERATQIYGDQSGIAQSYNAAIKDNNEELAEINAKIAAAEPELKKQLETYRAQGFSIGDIAKQLKVSEDIINRISPPDFKQSLVNSEALQKSMEKMPEAQRLAVNQVIAQTEGYEKASAAVTDLQKKLADAKNIGDVEGVKKIEQELADAQRVADEMRIELKTKLDSKDAQDGLKALPAEAQAQMAPVIQTVSMVNDGDGEAKVREGVAALATDITNLQTKAAQTSSEELKKQYGSELLQKQQQYRKNLADQANNIGGLTNLLAKQKIAADKATNPQEQQHYNAQIAITEQRLEGAKKGFANSAVAAQRLGATKGDVRQLGTELGFSGQAAHGWSSSQKEVNAQLAVSLTQAGGLAEEFENARKAAQQGMNTATAEAAQLVIELREKGLSEVDRAAKEEQLKLARARASEFVKQSKDFDKILEDEQRRSGQKETASHSKRLGSLSRFQLDRKKLIDAARAREIKDELARQLFEINAEKAQADAEAAFERRNAERTFAASKKSADDRTTLTDALRQADEKARLAADKASLDRRAAEVDARKKLGVEILKIDDEIFQAKLAELKLQADAITEQDIESQRQRVALLKAVAEGEKEAKLEGLLQNSELFQRIAKEQSETEIGAVVDANLAAATAQQRVIDRQRELQDAIDERREELVAKNKDITEAQISADAEYKKRVEAMASDSGLKTLTDEAQKEGTRLVTARENLSTHMEGIRSAMLAALTLPAEELTDQQRQILASFRAEDADAKTALIQQILNTGAAADAAIKKTVEDGEKAIREIAEKLRIDSITDVAEREREVKRAEVRKTYEDDLKTIVAAETFIAQQRLELRQKTGEILAQFNREFSAATTEDERADAADRRDAALADLEARLGTEEEFVRKLEGLSDRRVSIEKRRRVGESDADTEYLKKKDAAYSASTHFVQGLFDEMYKGIDEARRRELSRELSDIRKQRTALLDDIKQRKITLRDYVTQSADLLKQQQDKEKALGLDSTNFWSNLYRGTLAGLKAVAQSYADGTAGALKNLADTAKANLKKVADAGGSVGESFGALFDGSKESMEQLVNVAAGTFGSIGIEFARLAESGKATLGDFANAAILQVLKTAQAAIAAYIPQIMAAFASLGPWGIPAGIAAIAVVQGALAVAQSKVQGSLSKKGFSTGGYTGEEGGIVHPREFVMNPKLTAEHRPFFQRIHTGQNPLLAALAEYGPALSRSLSSLAISPDGLLVQLARSLPPVDIGGLAALSRLSLPIPSAAAIGVTDSRENAVMITKAVEESGDNISANLGRRIDKTNRVVTQVAEEVRTLRRVRPVSPHYWGSR